MKIKVKDLYNGKIFSNDMSENNNRYINAIHFCTSYTQVCVTDKTEEIESRNYDLFLPPERKPNEFHTSTKYYSIDEIDHEGEWILIEWE